VTAPIDLSRLNIAVGHATDEAGATGLTVIRGTDYPLRAGVASFGRASGSRELLTATPDHLVNGRIDAILFTGGSAYGLDACAGVMDWMEDFGRGFPTGPGVVPIVPAAVVFDLTPLGKFEARPTRAMAFSACETASSIVTEGAVGAGAGVTVGKILGPDYSMKSGFGCSMIASPDGEFSIAAMAVVNAFGDVRDAHGQIIAGARNEDGTFADTVRIVQESIAPPTFNDLAMRNTTLVVVACSTPLSSLELTQIARAAGAGLYRRITPVATSFDGDLVFAVSPTQGSRSRLEPIVIESLAVSCVEGAIERAVRLARGRDGIPGLADSLDERPA
jgi:L-aminopeptidase/D-esterase-like protein